MMSHEKLDVYQLSIEFLSLVAQLRSQMPKGNADLADQLIRASISVPLNIAEAVGKTSRADMRRFLAIARGSSLECAAIMDVMIKLELTGSEQAVRGKMLLHRVVAMLTKMILAPESSTPRSKTTTTLTEGRSGPRPRWT